MKFLTTLLLLSSFSALAATSHQLVSLKEENCHPVPAEYQTASGDSQEFCGTVDGLAVSVVTIGEGSYLHLKDANNDFEITPTDSILGGGAYIESTAADFTLVNGKAVGLIVRANGNSGKSRLMAVRLNRESGKVCKLGVFKSNGSANKAVSAGNCL